MMLNSKKLLKCGGNIIKQVLDVIPSKQLYNLGGYSTTCSCLKLQNTHVGLASNLIKRTRLASNLIKSTRPPWDFTQKSYLHRLVLSSNRYKSVSPAVLNSSHISANVLRNTKTQIPPHTFTQIVRNFHSHCSYLAQKYNPGETNDTSAHKSSDQYGEERAIEEEIKYLQNKMFSDRWGLRLATENAYLSWCRNVYLACVVGAAINMQEVFPYNKDVAFVFFCMAGINLMTGTASYIFNTLYMRKNMEMSIITVSVYIVLAVLHLLLWLGAMAIYLGYVEEEEEADQDKNNESTSDTARRKTNKTKNTKK